MTPITSKIRSSVLPCWAVSAVRMRPQKNSPTSHFFAGRQLGFGIGSELNTPTKVMLYLINKTKVNALNFHRSPSERKWIEPLNHPPLSSSLPNMDLAEDSAPNIAGLSSVSPHSSRHFGANVTFFYFLAPNFHGFLFTTDIRQPSKLTNHWCPLGTTISIFPIPITISWAAGILSPSCHLPTSSHNVLL